LALDWTLGSRASCSAAVTNVTVSGAGINITVPAISFPSAAGSPSNPLAALGVDAAHAEDLLRALVARAAAAWGGTPAHVITALLGVHAGLDGLHNRVRVSLVGPCIGLSEIRADPERREP